MTRRKTHRLHVWRDRRNNAWNGKRLPCTDICLARPKTSAAPARYSSEIGFDVYCFHLSLLYMSHPDEQLWLFFFFFGVNTTTMTFLINNDCDLMKLTTEKHIIFNVFIFPILFFIFYIFTVIFYFLFLVILIRNIGCNVCVYIYIYIVSGKLICSCKLASLKSEPTPNNLSNWSSPPATYIRNTIR